MNELISVVIGFWVGVGATYIFTHPEFRSALFSRIHTTVDAVYEKIKAALSKHEGT